MRNRIPSSAQVSGSVEWVAQRKKAFVKIGGEAARDALPEVAEASKLNTTTRHNYGPTHEPPENRCTKVPCVIWTSWIVTLIVS